MENKYVGSSFEDTLYDDLRDNNEIVFLHLKNALDEPSSGPDDDYGYLLKAINDVAIARGKTLVAEKAGISRAYLHKILNGSSTPSISNVLAILNAIGLRFSVEQASSVISDRESLAKAIDVAAYVCTALPSNATVMKIQKILYYSQVESLVHFDKKLFPERIEAWMAGPVVKEVFQLHKGLRFAKNIKFGDPENLSLEQRASVNWAVHKYGEMTGDTLSHLTHIEDPWKNARKGIKDGESGNVEITDESIIEYYTNLPDYEQLDEEAESTS